VLQWNFFRKIAPPAATLLIAMTSDDSTRWPTPATNRIDWPTVLAKHGRWLRTILLARVGDPLAVDDVLQEVHAAAVAKGHALRDTEKVAPWLYRIAVASALEYRRRMGRRRKLLAHYAEQLPSTDKAIPDPLAWLLAEERQTLMRQALARLPRREAEMLLLKYSEDWSYQQIADHLGLSISAVESRLHRARHRMRRTLAALDPDLATNAK
jgi:RNA polymerase sigma factor (sigma-70 family)